MEARDARRGLELLKAHVNNERLRQQLVKAIGQRRAERTPEQSAPKRTNRDGLTRTRDEQTALDNISTRARREKRLGFSDGYGESVHDYINRNARIDLSADTEGDDSR